MDGRAMPSISLRLDLEADGRIGPGKVELLEQIPAYGSISAGARQMGMSYKHAWLLVEDMNRLFRKPVVAARKGGRRGGGAQRTPALSWTGCGGSARARVMS
jgi:molybdate transport system regulatory protein